MRHRPTVRPPLLERAWHRPKRSAWRAPSRSWPKPPCDTAALPKGWEATRPSCSGAPRCRQRRPSLRRCLRSPHSQHCLHCPRYPRYLHYPDYLHYPRGLQHLHCSHYPHSHPACPHRGQRKSQHQTQRRNGYCSHSKRNRSYTDTVGPAAGFADTHPMKRSGAPRGGPDWLGEFEPSQSALFFLVTKGGIAPSKNE